MQANNDDKNVYHFAEGGKVLRLRCSPSSKQVSYAVVFGAKEDAVMFARSLAEMHQFELRYNEAVDDVDDCYTPLVLHPNTFGHEGWVVDVSDSKIRSKNITDLLLSQGSVTRVDAVAANEEMAKYEPTAKRGFFGRG